jgi:hypothetical protein
MAHILNTRVKSGNVLVLSGSSVEISGTVSSVNGITAPSFTGSLNGNASTVTNGVYTTNIATVATTAVTAGNGLTGGGTVGALTVDVGAGTGITVNANDVAIDTTVVPRLGAANTFTLANTFSNNYVTASVGITGSDAKFTSITGALNGSITGNAATVTNGVYTTTIATVATTGVTAGAGLTGGGTVGVLTIDVAAGTGITTAGDTVAIDTAVVPRLGVANSFTAANTFGGGYVTASLGITGSDAKFTSITGSHSGNSTTATALQTARTLTIGSTGKSFDGSAAVSWTLAEIGAVGLTSNNTFTGVNTFNTNYITGSITGSDAKFTSITGTLNGNITGNAATVTNGIYTTNIASNATTAVTAGNGLTGGGTVGALTLNVGAGTGITVAADTVAIDTTAVATLGTAQTFTAAKTFQAATTLSGALYVSYASTSIAYTVGANDNVVFVTGGPYTVTVPSATANAGRKIIFKKAEATETSVTLSAAAGTIDGGTFELNGPYQSVTLVSNGTNWFIM